MSHVYNPSAVALPSGITLPDDLADDADAASVNVPIETVADGIKYLTDKKILISETVQEHTESTDDPTTWAGSPWHSETGSASYVDLTTDISPIDVVASTGNVLRIKVWFALLNLTPGIGSAGLFFAVMRWKITSTTIGTSQITRVTIPVPDTTAIGPVRNTYAFVNYQIPNGVNAETIHVTLQIRNGLSGNILDLAGPARMSVEVWGGD